MLANGLGHYELAADAARRASAAEELVISPWALYELTEAAARSNQRERAAAAADRLAGIAEASGTRWARGAAARSRALVAAGPAADQAYREAIELLDQTRMATHAARARLSYGEWLRRENRRIDARAQLRLAFDALAALGVQAFAERARRELLATGEKVRTRHQDPGAELTPRSGRSPGWRATGGPTPRSARSCSSGLAPWSGTCARCSPSSTSAPAASSTRRCAATRWAAAR